MNLTSHLVSPLRRSRVLELARRPRFKRDLRVLGVVPSTLDVAADLARRGAPDGTTVVADGQFHGRGRRGGAWISSPGHGLYFTALVRPAPEGRQAALVSGAAGLAAAEAVRRVTGGDARLKWPNDVWLDGRKIGGVLIETSGGADSYAAVGVGITLVPPSEDDAAPGVAPLGGLAFLVEAEPAREALCAALMDALDERLEWAASDPERLRAEYRERDALKGLEVVLELPDGPVSGVVRHADLADGLVLERPDGSRFRVQAALAHVSQVVRRES
ncbi:MAG TPA: biotin--[acetyl-CoA-carboxylase] ligase [Planctomycetota bacterium]|nr:biotin--[acetyl-CoA-carboxylase] ligase [Planctomycetota bacterium]